MNSVTRFAKTMFQSGFRGFLPGYHLPKPVILLVYAFFIGITGGYAALGFRTLIEFFQQIFFGYLKSGFSGLGSWGVMFLPLIGIVLVSIIVQRFAPEAKGHGVPEVMKAVALNHGIIRPRVVLIKAVASALCIGSGGSVGREGPIVQIGSAFGSSFGQLLGVSKHQLRLLVACGAAAGIAATFNTPIGGVLFASEIILGSFAIENFVPISIASVVSAAIGRFYLGNNPMFPITVGTADYSLYGVSVVLGIIAGVWALIYIKVLYGIEGWFDRRAWPFWLKALFGGTIVGAVGIWFPQIFGVGYDVINDALHNQLELHLMLMLLVLKLLATSVTIAAGGSGGVFSPGLYMGTMMGAVLGVAVNIFIPDGGINPGVVAVLGMAGVFAGSVQAPVTAIIMLFELTGDYKLILPLVITAVLAATVTHLFSKETIYTGKLLRRGIDILQMRQPNKMKMIHVKNALRPEQLTINVEQTAMDAWKQFADTKEWFALVRDKEGKLVGSLSRAKVLEAIIRKRQFDPVSSLLTQKIFQIQERASLADAAEKMNYLGVSYLLVCHGQTPVGVVGYSDIIHAYREI